MLDHIQIQRKWIKKWEEAGLGKAEPKKGSKKFFMIFAYPTVSGFQHTGHMRGYSYADAISRYKRMKGFNVLFTAGAHSTGNGAIAKAHQIKTKKSNEIEDLRKRKLSDNEIQKLSDPLSYVDYFSKTYVEDYKNFGFLGDWSRFTVTTNEDYKKFITWQFLKLKEKKLLIQKPYYASFCPNCGPVSIDPSQMDLLKGGNAEKQEFTLIKLKFGNGKQYLVAATLRPETMYGQTNVWIDSKEIYLKILVNDEVWIVSKECADKLKYQKENIQVTGKLKGKELLGKFCHAPALEKEVMILPSKFCNPNIGTGIVTSVPSDAPIDWMGLHDLQKSEELCKKYGIDNKDVLKIKPIPIINLEGYGKFPAVEICEKMNIKSQDDIEKLEKAKKEIYTLGYHKGLMAETCGKYSKMKVDQTKKLITEELIQNGDADIFYDLSEEVVCRCGRKVIIKKADDQWFIRYSDSRLTINSKKHAKSMRIEPETYYNSMQDALDWFEDRPCARQGKWLGTPFPFDKTYIIEAISDSTLYPLYYLVSKYVNNQTLNANNLTESFFDYVFLKKGNLKNVVKDSKVKKDILIKIQNDVDYWYPLDINLGGKEHQRVHFPPFVMNHVAILPKKYWPLGIFVNNWIMHTAEEKLSKSKGGAEPIPGMAKKYSVDAMRLYYSNTGSPFMDILFDQHSVFRYRERLEKIYSFIFNLDLKGKGTEGIIDQWLISKMNKSIKRMEAGMEAFSFKEYTDEAYYEMHKNLQWYLMRNGNNKKLIQNYLRVWVPLISIFTPFLAEEVWEKLGNKEFVSLQQFPHCKEKEILDDVEAHEDMLLQLREDITSILNLVNIKNPKCIKVFVADEWKFMFFMMVREKLKETRDVGMLIKFFMNSKLKQHGQQIMKMLPGIVKSGKIPLVPTTHESEFSYLKNSAEFLEKEFKCNVEIIRENESEEEKARQSLPSKPAILVL